MTSCHSSACSSPALSGDVGLPFRESRPVMLPLERDIIRSGFGVVLEIVLSYEAATSDGVLSEDIAREKAS